MYAKGKYYSGCVPVLRMGSEVPAPKEFRFLRIKALQLDGLNK